MVDQPIDNALVWDEQGVPYSRTFADTYFDRTDGLRESNHVFVDGCDLESAWTDRQSFKICELGFGTGLNFLATWARWRTASNPSRVLHYIGVEAFPLMLDDMRRAASLFSDLNPLSDALLDQYGPPHPGFHRIWLNDCRVCLTLAIGSARDMLNQLIGPIDAWYLDGFAPDRNPQMWDQSVFKAVADLSAPSARLATYSVAGHVRRGLSEAGFKIAKRPGHGKKKHVLSGQKVTVTNRQDSTPWFRIPTPGGRPKHIVVIGAGIAGACVARVALDRGISVTVIDRRTCIAAEASSVERAVLSPRLTVAASMDSEFYAHAWQCAIAFYEKLSKSSAKDAFTQIGTFIVARSREEFERLSKIARQRILPSGHYLLIDAASSKTTTGVTIKHGGLYLPSGGLLNMKQACRALFEGIKFLGGQSVSSMALKNDAWSVADAEGQEIVSADAVVVACGISTQELEQCAALPLSCRLGQLTAVGPTSASTELKTVLAGSGTITPAMGRHHVIGATFDHLPADTQTEMRLTTAEADRRNLETAQKLLPGAFEASEPLEELSWAGVRSTTPDHLPIAGPVPILGQYPDLYGDLHHGRHWQSYPDAPYYDGLYVVAGLGARGGVSAPLLAELVVSEMCGDPLPVSLQLANALHPGRIAIRSLQRPSTL